MKFRVHRTSRSYYRTYDDEGNEVPDRRPVVEIETIEDLRDLPGRDDEPLVIHFNHWDSDLPVVEIYDDYRE